MFTFKWPYILIDCTFKNLQLWKSKVSLFYKTFYELENLNRSQSRHQVYIFEWVNPTVSIITEQTGSVILGLHEPPRNPEQGSYNENSGIKSTDCWFFILNTLSKNSFSVVNEELKTGCLVTICLYLKDPFTNIIRNQPILKFETR